MPRFFPSGLAALFSFTAFAADIGAVKDVGTGTNGFRALVTDDRPTTPLLAPASNEGQARIKQFKLLPGMKVDLWAAEPMLANPVAFSVDELGRVWTSETYRYRSSVLDIRHYMFMLEDDLAARSIDDRLKQIRKWFGPDGEKALSKETEVIRMLEDTDHDGKADKSTLVADGLNSPLDGIASGILARHGQVWFTDIPSVWRFHPAGGGQAIGGQASSLPGPTGFQPAAAGETARLEARPASAGWKPALPASSPLASRPSVHLDGYEAEELLRGWGIRFSFTGHDLHGLKFGPDGRLYFSVGDRGTHIVTKEGNVIDLPDEGAVFRCEPDGSQLEVFAHGLRNPQELAFDEYGNLFTGDNDSDQGDRERWEYVVEGGDYGWRVGYQHAPLGNAGPWNMERLWVPHFEGQAAYIIPPIANIGDGPSGLVYNYGTGLPAALDHRFLLADFKGTSAKSGIYSLRNRPSGAGFELVAHDQFIWNTLVPDVDIGPDGAVWFADWHEGWPKSNKGRIYRAYFPEALADPVVKETAMLLADGMTKRGDAELLALLAHRDMRVRQEAQFELAARGPKSFAGLKQVAFDSKNQFARIHAIWGIGQIARKAPTHLLDEQLFGLLKLVRDNDKEVVGQTLLTLGDVGCANLGDVYRSNAIKSWPERLRLQAAVAIGRLWHNGSSFRFQQLSAKNRAAAKLNSQKAEMLLGMLGVDPYDMPPPEPIFPLIEMLQATGANDPITLSSVAHAAIQQLSFDCAEIYSFKAQPSPLAPNVRLAIILTLRKRIEENRSGQTHSANPPSISPAAKAALPNFQFTDPVVSLIEDSLSDPDPLLVLEAARAINDVPITNALPALAVLAEPAKLDPLLKQFAALKPSPPPASAPGSIRDVRADQPLPWGDTPIDQLTLMLLRVVNANFRVGTPETAQRLATLATRTDLSDLIRSEALHGLATWAKPHPRDRIMGVFRPLPPRDVAPARAALEPKLAQLLGKSSESVRIAAAEAAAALQLTGAVEPLFALVTDTQAPANARATALRALVTVASTRNLLAKRDEALAFAAKDSAESLRLAASKLNAELNPNDAAGQLTAKLTGGSLAEQQSAFTSLGDLKSDAADAILAEWMDNLMKREVANEVMLDLVEAAAKRSAGAVKSRLETYAKWKLPQDHLTPYRETLSGGDAARGKKIFYENAAVACTRCHHIGTDGGGNAGPILDGLASRQTREYLLESIVAPNQQIVQGFESATLTLKNGTSYAGVVKSETDTELTLLSPEDGDVKLKKADIAVREKGLSGMPEGVGQLLTKQELRDVIEFLGTLK